MLKKTLKFRILDTKGALITEGNQRSRLVTVRGPLLRTQVSDVLIGWLRFERRLTEHQDYLYRNIAL
jgi:hypothetical protein